MIDARSKVRGCFLGLAIGDALGKPVETYKAEKIAEKWGRITEYFVNSEHKYFDGLPPGGWTDDTQLSLAVARAFIYTGEFNLDVIAEEHATEFMKTIAGWGKTTIEAIGKIVDGKHWDQVGPEVVNKPGPGGNRRGVGNGVCMKVAPVGLYMAMTNPGCDNPQWSEDVRKLSKFATMTHFTSIAITSGLAQAIAVHKCFTSQPKNFDVNSFIRVVNGAGKMGEKYMFKTIGEDNIASRFKMLENWRDYDDARTIADFGGGTPYVYDSLPFSYMFFVRNPKNIDCLYDCVSAGGDTDTNGSMVGALLGALHGEEFFPEHLVGGLTDVEQVLDTADKFYSKFGG